MSIADHLTGIKAFVEPVECGSFSAAANADACVALVSRRERRAAGRTPRHASLSSHDTQPEPHRRRQAPHRCLSVLAELEQVEDELGHGRGDVMGRLWMKMPVHLRRGLAPVLFRLALRHPGLLRELSFADRRVDLVEEGYDLAVRSGPVPDSVHYHARFLGSETRVLCAAPAYLAAHGAPLGVADLAEHRGIFYGRANDSGE